MPTPKDSKAIAGLIDITYHRRPHWFRWWRRFLVVFTGLVTIAIVTYQITGHRERWLNPGHVSAAHALFENDCAQCHDNDHRGGFSKAVSDTACMACHRDAAAHNPHADLHPGKQGAVHLTSLKNPMKSADCVVCHIEHRGQAALAGTSDQLCVQCHGDLANHMKDGAKPKAGFDLRVTSFKPGNHPEFGRSLPRPTTQILAAATQPVTPWADNTVLKFNHSKHLNPQGSIHIQGCASCHSTEDRSTGRLASLSSATQPANTSARRYMRPVSYERDCRSCHSVGLPATKELERVLAVKVAPIVTHGSMDVVRAELNDLDHRYLALVEDHPDLLKAGKPVAEWLKEQQDELVESHLKKVKTLGEALVDAQEATQKSIDAREELKKEMEKKPVDAAKVKELLDQVNDPESPISAAERAKYLFAAAAEQQVAVLNSSSNCSKCHETAGKVVLAADYATALSSGKRPATGADALRFRTLPTGLPESPRRWFGESDFNHDAHRTTACLDCHQGIERDGLGGKPDDGIARMPNLKSCAACHIPDHAEMRGANAGCVTCHHFHDR